MAATNNASQNAIFNSPPLLGFVAASETEISILLISLLGAMKTLQLRVAVLRQSTANHKAGKRQADFKAAGAELVMTLDNVARACSRESLVDSILHRDEVRQQFNPNDIDLILVDGFAGIAFPRIEIHRPCIGKKPRFTADKSIIAVAADEYLDTGSLPLLNIHSAKEIAGYINRWLRSDRSGTV